MQIQANANNKEKKNTVCMKAGGSDGEGRSKRIVGTQYDTEQAVETQCPRNRNKRESFIPCCQIKKKKIA